MDMSKMGELIKLQQEAMKKQKELENTVIESEVSGLVISMNCAQKVEKVDFETLDLIPGLDKKQKKALEEAILEATNKAMKNTQEIAADKMSSIMSQMGLDIPKGGLPQM